MKSLREAVSAFFAASVNYSQPFIIFSAYLIILRSIFTMPIDDRLFKIAWFALENSFCFMKRKSIIFSCLASTDIEDSNYAEIKSFSEMISENWEYLNILRPNIISWYSPKTLVNLLNFISFFLFFLSFVLLSFLSLCLIRVCISLLY